MRIKQFSCSIEFQKYDNILYNGQEYTCRVRQEYAIVKNGSKYNIYSPNHTYLLAILDKMPYLNSNSIKKLIMPIIEIWGKCIDKETSNIFNLYWTVRALDDKDYYFNGVNI